MTKKESKDKPDDMKKRHFHFSLFVFFGAMILTFSLWGAFLRLSSEVDQSIGSNLMLSMGVLFSIAVGLFSWSLETRRDFLQKEIQKRTIELEEKNKELGRTNKEIESFIYTMSHDLKAPLVSIQGFASILKSDHRDQLQDTGLSYLNRILYNAKQMNLLIHDLLEFSRIGRMEEKREDVDMNQLFRDIIEELGHEIRKKKITVENPGNFPSLFGSCSRLRQVFMNLIGNAVKYIGKSEIPKITLHGAERQGGLYEIAVEDNGIGIPEAVRGKVFQIFQRFHPESGIEGTGLGLSIVKKITEYNGGEVSFQSEPGRGTIFYVTWPRTNGQHFQ